MSRNRFHRYQSLCMALESCHLTCYTWTWIWHRYEPWHSKLHRNTAWSRTRTHNIHYPWQRSHIHDEHPRKTQKRQSNLIILSTAPHYTRPAATTLTTPPAHVPHQHTTCRIITLTTRTPLGNAIKRIGSHSQRQRPCVIADICYSCTGLGISSCKPLKSALIVDFLKELSLWAEFPFNAELLLITGGRVVATRSREKKPLVMV